MVNPFMNEHGELVHLASRTIAPPEVAEDMKTMLQKGETDAVEFMKTHHWSRTKHTFNVKENKVADIFRCW